MNAQPWELVVVDDPLLLAKLGVVSKNAGHVARAPLAIVVVMAGTWHGEPYDEGRLSERIMLAAKAHGLGAGVGWFNTPETSAAAKSLLGVPAERTLRTVISIGYPAANASGPRRERPRKDRAEIVSHNRYGAPLP
jgi:nitroreductase